MLDWVVEKIWTFVTWVPALFLEEDSHRYVLFRGMAAIVVAVLVLCAIAFWPFRGAVIRYLSMKLSVLLGKK
jgi:hypothetical protein